VSRPYDGVMSNSTARNRLADEASPYLRDHADNPVDWQPWDEAALATAREEEKPIFLSVGYAACHWCHVMADESFEDETVADLRSSRSRSTGRNARTWTASTRRSVRR